MSDYMESMAGGQIEGAISENESLRQEVDRLRAEVEALRKDAERYQWLRKHGDTGCTEKDGWGGQTLRIGERLDAAIDAAKGGGNG